MSKSHVIFIQAPPSLAGHSVPSDEHRHGADAAPEADHFTIDPAIPLPVELEADTNPDLDAAAGNGANPVLATALNDLSTEMLLAGMLRVLAKPDDYTDALTKDKNGLSLEEKLNYYRQFVLTVRPHLPQELTAAAIAKNDNKEFAMALEMLDALRGLTPGNPSVLFNRALVLQAMAGLPVEAEVPTETTIQNTARAQAEAAWEEVLALHPPFADGLFNAACYFQKESNFSRARDIFQDYLELVSEEEENENPGLKQKKDYAEQSIEAINRNSLDDEEFRNASDLVKSGHEEEGMAKIRLFLERQPLVWNAWFLLGWALRRKERWAEAQKAFEQARSCASEHGDGSESSPETSVPETERLHMADIDNELAICLMEQGQLDAAHAALEEALGLAGDDDNEMLKIISNLGVLALRQGKRDEARGFFQTVLAIDPSDPLAQQYSTC
jgi:tetratricopeptide (TPR) repeat protein